MIKNNFSNTFKLITLYNNLYFKKKDFLDLLSHLVSILFLLYSFSLSLQIFPSKSLSSPLLYMPFYRKIKIIVILIFSNFLISCKEDCRDYKKLLNDLKKDNQITIDGCSKVREFVEKNKSLECTKKFEGSSTIEEFSSILQKDINNTNVSVSCGSNSDTEKTLKTITYFLDPSGSMEGYVKGSTDFKRIFGNLFTSSWENYPQESIALKYVGKSTKQYSLGSTENLKKITSEPFSGAGIPFTNTETTSEFYKIIENILKDISRENLIVFFSDNIYIPEKGLSSETLDSESSVIKTLFIRKLKEIDFSTTMLQCDSTFTGKYTDFKKKNTNIENVKRPFYIWMIGSDTLIQDYLNSNHNIFSREKEICSNTINFNSRINYNNLEYIPLYYNQIGDYRIDREDGSLVLNSLDSRKENKILFSIAIKLPSSPLWGTDPYLLNSENYKLPENYELKSIESISNIKLKDNDKLKVRNDTHIFSIQVNKLPSDSENEVTLEIPIKLPDWVDSRNTLDDSDLNMNQSKTFGLNIILNGINDAYLLKNKNPDKLKISIKIKKG